MERVFHRRESEDQRKKEVPEDAMLEHADASEMCIREMTVIFMSLGVTTANFKVATDLVIQPFDIGFERGIVADYASWMNCSGARGPG